MAAFSSNRFALLDEAGDDDNDVGAPTQQTGKVPSAVAAQPNKPVPAPTTKVKPAGSSNRGRGGEFPSRGGNRRTFGEQRPPAETGGADEARETRGERGGRGGRGGPRGGRGALGRGRGGRGGAKADRPDRHSATGVTDTDKKIAAGWGAEEGKSELQAENDGWGDANAEVSAPGTPGANGTAAAAAEWDKPTAAETPAPEAKAADAAPADEEEQTKTLDEYLAERAAGARIGPTLSGRKANEGADDAQWKDGVALLRDGNEDSDWFFGKAKKGPTGPKKTKEGKTFIDVEPQAYRPPRSDRGAPGGGRGRGEGRGRGRGEFRGRGDGPPRGGRGGFRGGRGGSSSASRDLNTEDATAFPSLS